MGVSRLLVDHKKCERENRTVSSASPPFLCLPRSRQSPTGRLDCESFSLLTIVLLIHSLSLLLPSFFLPTVILEKPIRIPRSLSVKAAGVLKGFLNKVRQSLP